MERNHFGPDSSMSCTLGRITQYGKPVKQTVTPEPCWVTYHPVTLKNLPARVVVKNQPPKPHVKPEPKPVVTASVLTAFKAKGW